jgi:hypothetical protein
LTRGVAPHRCRARPKKAVIPQGLAAFVRAAAARVVADRAAPRRATHEAVCGALRHAIHNAIRNAMHDANHRTIGP